MSAPLPSGTDRIILTVERLDGSTGNVNSVSRVMADSQFDSLCDPAYALMTIIADLRQQLDAKEAEERKKKLNLP